MFEISKKGTPDKAPEGSARQESGAPRTESSHARNPGAGSREAAVIGPSIHIDGDLRGEEDLLIEGEVNGTVQLKNNSLTIGPQGKVSADMYAHSIYVDGYVDGDLYGSERVHIRKSAQVRGNVTSPRVSLEDGAKFKGSIEMDPQAMQNASGARAGATKPAATAPAPAPAPAVKQSSGQKFGDGQPAKPEMSAAAAVKTGAAS
jgi:cytoskeletal protein CcmA (bactofilin family)